MKIAIDCRSLRKKPAGVANFLIGVINHLAILQKEWQIYLLSNEDFSEETKKKLSSAANIIKVIEPLPFLSNIATIWYLLKVTAILKKLSIDLIYCPIPNLPFFIPANVKTLITVHDMVYRRFPETMSIGNRMINFCLHDYSINTADRLWAVSHYTKSEIESIYPFRKCKKIEVVHQSINQFFIPGNWR